MAFAGVDGSKTGLEWVAIKGVLLGGGKRSGKYLKTAWSQKERNVLVGALRDCLLLDQTR